MAQLAGRHERGPRQQKQARQQEPAPAPHGGGHRQHAGREPDPRAPGIGGDEAAQHHEPGHPEPA